MELLTYSDLAQRLGVPKGTVKRWPFTELLPVGCPIVVEPNRRRVDFPAAKSWERTLQGQMCVASGPIEGAVYFIQSAAGGPIKLGWAKDVWRRLMVLQSAHADELVLLAAMPGNTTLEKAFHAYFKAEGQHIRGEWFRPELPMLFVELLREQQVTDSEVA